MRKIIFFIVLFLFSCTTTQTRIYSININQYPQESKRVKVDAGVFVDVKSNKHFRQSYITYRSSIYEMMQSLYAKWDSPPDDFLKEQIKNALIHKGLFKEVQYVKSALRQKYFVLDVYLKDFSRFDDGDTSYAILRLDIGLKNTEGEIIYKKDFDFKQKLDDRTYLNLTKGMSMLMSSALITMADEIEEALLGFLGQEKVR